MSNLPSSFSRACLPVLLPPPGDLCILTFPLYSIIVFLRDLDSAVPSKSTLTRFLLSFRSLRGTKNSQLPPRPRPVTRQLQGHNTSPPITSQGLTQRPPRVKFSNQSDGWSRRWAGLQGPKGWGWMGLPRAVARTRIRGERMDRGTDEEHVGLW